MFNQWEHKFKEFLTEPSGTVGNLFKGLLRFTSAGYSTALSLRNKAFDHNLMPQHSSKIPYVISVGNIQAGGTGKTPFTLMLALKLQEHLKVAIVTRGYKSIASKLNQPIHINNGNSINFSPKFCGDEPYLLAQRLKKIPVIISKKRIHGANLAENLGTEVLILDDGFQHRQLKRNFDIVLVDVALACGINYMLPRGLLREHPTSLSRANLIVLTNFKDHDHLDSFTEYLKQFSSASVISAKRMVAEIWGNHGRVSTCLNFQKAGLFCGIANPSSFLHTVSELGVQVVAQYCLADHATYDLKLLSEIAEKASKKGATCLICTEKDAVKAMAFADSLPLPLMWPRIDMQIYSGQAIWENWLQEVIQQAKT